MQDAVSSRLRAAFGALAGLPVADGPDFVFEQAPTLFLGRRGRGPLRVAWDTNLLIDYFEHGRALWEGTFVALDSTLPYAAELETLPIMLATWVLRDIRFYVLPETVNDARTLSSKMDRSTR